MLAMVLPKPAAVRGPPVLGNMADSARLNVAVHGFWKASLKGISGCKCVQP